MKFWKFVGASSPLSPCPIFGPQELANISLSENFFTFLPKGVLKIKAKNYNDEDGMLFGASVVFVNT